MSKKARRLLKVALGAMVSVTALHLWLNVQWDVLMNGLLPRDERKVTVGYIPVT